MSLSRGNDINNINFGSFNVHSKYLFLNNSLLRLDDIIKTEQFKIAFDFIHNNFLMN